MRADGTTKIVSDTFLGRMFSTKSSFSIRRPVVQLTQEEAVCRIQRMTRIHRCVKCELLYDLVYLFLTCGLYAPLYHVQGPTKICFHVQ